MHPVLFEIGGFHLQYNGVIYVLAILAVYWRSRRDLGRTKIKLDTDPLINLIILTFLGAILGARIYYVLLNLDYYSSTKIPWYTFALIWRGGLAIHGGLVLGGVSLWLYCKTHRLPFTQISDIFAANLLLGQAIGRMGNFMNGDAYGFPTMLPWGVVFRYGPAAQEFPGAAVHPVMLYEMILNLVGYAIIRFTVNKGLKPGFITSLYLLEYGLIRIATSFLRADEAYIANLNAAHFVSGFMIFSSLCLIFGFHLYKKDRHTHKDEPQFLPSRQWKV